MCTVTVKDTDTAPKSPPLGTVDFEFTAQPDGSSPVVAPDPCTLTPDLSTVATDDSTCTGTVTFTANTLGSYTIKGTYLPTPVISVHATSNGSDTIDVKAGPPATVTEDPITASNRSAET